MSLPPTGGVPGSGGGGTPSDEGGFQEKYRIRMAALKSFREILMRNFKRHIDVSVIDKKVREAIMPLIPVRSGRLLDTILNTMKVELTHFDSNNLYYDLTYTHALGRTDPVGPGRVKHGIIAVGEREFGLGEDYIPTHTIPNVHRITSGNQTQNTTLYGNPLNTVLYELDDPTAREEVQETIKNLYIAAFIPELEKALGKLKLPPNWQIGAISGEILQSENMEKYIKGGLS